MRCEEIREEIGGYLDGALDDASREQVSAHVSECDTCGGELAELAALKDELAALPLPPLSADFNARVMQAVQPSLTRCQRRAARGLRFRGYVDRLARLLFGEARPAPVTLAGMLRETLISGAAVTVLSVSATWLVLGRIVSFLYNDEPIVSRSFEAAVISNPLLHGAVRAATALPSETIGLIAAAQLLLAGWVLMRVMRPRALLVEVFEPGTVPLGRLIALCYGMAGLVMLVAFATMLVQSLTFYSWPLAPSTSVSVWQGTLLAWCALSWCLMARGRWSRVPVLAGLFYTSLLVTYMGNRAIEAAWYAGAVIANNMEECTWLVIPGEWLWRGLFLGIPLAGFTLAAAFALAGWRPGPWRRVALPAGALALAAGLSLVATSFLVRAELHTNFMMGQSLEDAAGLVSLPTIPRSVLIVSSKDARVSPYDLPSTLRSENVERLQRFVSRHPNTFVTPCARWNLINASIARWDFVGMWRNTMAYAISPGVAPWRMLEIAWLLARGEPSAQNVAVLDRLFSSADLVIIDRERASRMFAAAYKRQGDDAKAAVWAAKSGNRFSRQGGDKERPVRVKNGVVEGRLLLHGKPLSDVTVRLIGGRSMQSYDVPVKEKDVEAFRFDGESSMRSADNMRWGTSSRPMIVTHTDSAGRFRFTELVDDVYCVAFLLEMPADEASVLSRNVHAARPADITESQRHVDVGDIMLEPRP